MPPGRLQRRKAARTARGNACSHLLRHDLPNRLALVDLQAFAAGDFELARVEPEKLDDGGVHVGHIVAIFDSVETDFVGGSVDDATLDAAARHPDRETVDVVIAAIRPLRAGCAAEL